MRSRSLSVRVLTAAALAVTEVIEVPVRYSAVGIAAVMIAALQRWM